MSLTDIEIAGDITGACLCGGVRYAYRGPLGGSLGLVTVCHCAQCRKAQGFAVAAVPALAEGFTVTGGRERIVEYESTPGNTPGKMRAFCGACGSPLYSRMTAKPERLRLRIGAIDNPPDELVVEAHIYTEHIPAWAEPDDAPRYPTEEPDRRLG
jgi:hypothetical protein